MRRPRAGRRDRQVGGMGDCDGRAGRRRGGLRRLAERLERVHPREAVERAALDLLGLLRAHPQLAADLGAGALLALGAEAQGDHLALLLREGVQRLGDGLGEDGPVDLLLRRLVVGGAEVAERGGVGVVAELHVEARRRVVDGADLLDLLDLHAGHGRDLVQLGLTLELHRELVADAADLARLRRDVGGQADGTGGVVEAALDRLADPQRGVRREAEALAPVELLGRADQAEHALLDEVVQGEAVALVPAGDRDDQAQGRVDEAILGHQVAALDALGQLDLLGRLQQLKAVRPLQELLERVRVNVALMVFADLILRLGQDPPDRNPICTLGIIPSFGCVRNRWADARMLPCAGIESGSGRGKPAARNAHHWRPRKGSEHTLAVSRRNTLRLDEVVLLADLVATSQAVAATSARGEKVARLAEALRRLAPEEVRAGVAFLSGELRQRQIGVGWATLRDAPAGGAASEPGLTVAEVDAAFERIGACAGPGSQGERRRLLGELMARASEDEHRFLVRLLSGDLRQGALAGVMTDALARAAGLPLGAVRRALMLRGDLGAVAAVALSDREAGAGGGGPPGGGPPPPPA